VELGELHLLRPAASIPRVAITAAMIFFKILIACLLGPGRPLPSMLPFARHQRGRLKPSRPCRVDETAPPSIYMEAGRVEKVWGLAYVNGYFRALAYGQSQEAAVSKVQALALRVLLNAWSTASPHDKLRRLRRELGVPRLIGTAQDLPSPSRSRRVT
jgi:hypothetical protein